MAQPAHRSSFLVPTELFEIARQGLGMPAEATRSDVVRAALARAGGVDVADHTPRRTGRPPRSAASTTHSETRSVA
jgi:hypothetical protein